MGFEARHAILEVLDEAIADKKAQVRVVAYDLSEREVVLRLEEARPAAADHHRRQRRARRRRFRPRSRPSGGCSDGRQGQRQAAPHEQPPAQQDHRRRRPGGAGGGVRIDQLHVARVLRAVQQRRRAARRRRPSSRSSRRSTTTGSTTAWPASARRASAKWTTSAWTGSTRRSAFSPHAASNALLQTIADDIGDQTTSTSSTRSRSSSRPRGRSATPSRRSSKTDRHLRLRHRRQARSAASISRSRTATSRRCFPPRSAKNLPEPFKSEPTGLAGNVGTRMHHKFVVIDFDKPTARVYLGSYNFSIPADTQERREPAPDPRPPHRRLVHGRGAPHLRPLPLPRGPAGGEEGAERSSSSRSRRARPAKSRGGPRTTRTRGRSATASCSRNPSA